MKLLVLITGYNRDISEFKNIIDNLNFTYILLPFVPTPIHIINYDDFSNTIIHSINHTIEKYNLDIDDTVILAHSIGCWFASYIYNIIDNNNIKLILIDPTPSKYFKMLTKGNFRTNTHNILTSIKSLKDSILSSNRIPKNRVIITYLSDRRKELVPELMDEYYYCNMDNVIIAKYTGESTDPKTPHFIHIWNPEMITNILNSSI